MSPYYDRDGITIYHGDNRDILPMIGSVDLVLTDPPYGVSERTDRASKGRGTEGRGIIRHPARDWLPIAGDNEPFDPTPLLAFGKAVLFGANHFADRLPPTRSWIVWDKRNGSATDDNADAELIWTNIDGVVRMFRQCWRGFTREDDGLEPNEHLHPTQKPVKLMIWLLHKYTKPGDLVLDPYMGSGPVAQACHLTGRRYIGIEIEERYCEIAAKRLQQSVLPMEVPA